MPTPSWDKLDAFIQPADFAVVATITLQSGGTRTVRGIYDDPYLNADLGEYEADISEPRFTCKLADVAGVKRGDSVVIAGEVGTYDVLREPQGDGTGMCVLKLAHHAGP